MVLAILLMLSALSITIYGAAVHSHRATQGSLDTVRARQALDAAAELANAEMRTPAWSTATLTLPTHTDSTAGAPATATATRTWHRADQNQLAGGTLQLTGESGKKSATRTRQWRAKPVGHRTTTSNGRSVYGVMAPGTWTSALASSADSTLTGDVTGGWQLFGPGRANINPGSAVDQITTYNASAAPAGAIPRTTRSRLNASMDRVAYYRVMDQCIQASGTSPYRLPRYAPGTSIPAGLQCVYDTTIDTNTAVSGGPAVIYSYGDVTINANVTAGSGHPLYIYVIGGQVNIVGARTLNNVYIYAPYSHCRTPGSSATTTMTGSLACDRLTVNGTFAAGALPAGPQMYDHATWVSYPELPGFGDRFGN